MADTAYTCLMTEQTCTTHMGSHGSIIYCRCIEVLSFLFPSWSVVVATITIAVAFRRFSLWSGACTDISHIAAYEQCVAHRAFLLTRCDALVVRVSGQLEPS